MQMAFMQIFEGNSSTSAIIFKLVGELPLSLKTVLTQSFSHISIADISFHSLAEINA